MNAFDAHLEKDLAALRDQGLLRELRPIPRVAGCRITLQKRTLVNFSSNDYLGLSQEPALQEAALRALEQFGTGAGASRLICGSLAPHHELEETLAAFKGTEAALSFHSGYAAALGALGALAGRGDILLLDKRVHASLVDAARLTGATLRVFKHNDLDNLERLLRWADQPRAGAARGRVLVVTESLFSMDGDRAPLREMVELKDRHGAWLMVDEAHATGLYGPSRRGLAEALGLCARIEIQMGTLGKAAGASGGFIAGSRRLVDVLINRARSFIYTTAPPPAAAAAATAGVRFIQSKNGAERCALLWDRVARLRQTLALSPLPFPSPPAEPAAIIPLPVGDEQAAVRIAGELRDRGVFIPAIRYPTVSRGQARLRLTASAALQDEDIALLANALSTLKPSS